MNTSNLLLLLLLNPCQLSPMEIGQTDDTFDENEEYGETFKKLHPEHRGFIKHFESLPEELQELIFKKIVMRINYLREKLRNIENPITQVKLITKDDDLPVPLLYISYTNAKGLINQTVHLNHIFELLGYPLASMDVCNKVYGKEFFLLKAPMRGFIKRFGLWPENKRREAVAYGIAFDPKTSKLRKEFENLSQEEEQQLVNVFHNIGYEITHYEEVVY